MRGYIEVKGSEGTASGYVDEEGRDYLLITHRPSGERWIPVETVLSERESFQDEIDNFVKSIQAGVPTILNADVGVGVMAILDSAKLSELRNRVSVTPEDLAEFSREVSGGASDPWEGSDRIITALMEPYRLRQ